MKTDALEWIAKAGYAARAVVYFIVGGFAVLAAIGQVGGTPDTKGALLTLMGTGYGGVLLAVLGAGLFCHALWRLAQSAADADGHGTDIRGLAVRGGLLVSAVTHASLGFWALLSVPGGGSGGGRTNFAAWLMQQPYGSWLVMAAGACIIGAGSALIVKGAGRKFEKWLVADAHKMMLIRPVCMAGLIARGIVFMIVGGLFVYAGVAVDPSEAGGLPEALQWLRQLPLGWALYLVIAAGLVCFGAYSLIEAVCRRVTGARVLSPAG